MKVKLRGGELDGKIIESLFTLPPAFRIKLVEDKSNLESELHGEDVTGENLFYIRTDRYVENMPIYEFAVELSLPLPLHEAESLNV